MAKLHFELLPHPPYSPDLGPSGYYLLADLKIMLHGKRFGSNGKVIAETEAYFEAKDKSFYKKGIEMLEKPWKSKNWGEFCYRMKNLDFFIQINFIPFKVIPSRHNALILTFLPIVETLVKFDFRNCLQSLLRFGLYLFNRVKTASSEWSFEFRGYPEVIRSQIRRIWLLWNDMRWVFGEMVTKNECSVRQRIIVMQKPRVICPKYLLKRCWVILLKCQ